MATFIKTTCGDCGDVELGAGDVTVRLCADTDEGTYVFRCPRCELAAVRAAEPLIVELLVHAGVRLEHWTLPAELSERPGGPPLSHDDLIDFHEILQDDAWYTELTMTARPQHQSEGEGRRRA
jgi:hypothetical protein